MGKKKGRLTMREIIFEGIKKFAGEIIGILLLAGFIWMFPTVKPIVKEVRKWFDKVEDEIIQIDNESHDVKISAITSPANPKETSKHPVIIEQAQREQVKSQPQPVIKLNDKEFFRLCNSGNAAQIKEAVTNGANINAKDSDGWTALILAAYDGNNKVAEILVKYGADVNAGDKNGGTALMKAVSKGYNEIVELLLAHEANVNAQDKYGNTALILAAREGRVEIAELLLQHNADVNAEDNFGMTALMWATENKHTKTTSLLRFYGAKQQFTR